MLFTPNENLDGDKLTLTSALSDIVGMVDVNALSCMLGRLVCYEQLA